MRLSPRGAYNDMADSDPAATFGFAAERLGKLGIAYVHAMEPLPGHMMASPGERVSPLMRKAFKGPFIVNGGYDAALGAKAIDAGEADLVAFGVPFLANPDFVARARHAAAMNPPDYGTLYTPGPKGYTDYPALGAR